MCNMPDIIRDECSVNSLVSGFVIPAQAGIQITALDSRLRGKDESVVRWRIIVAGEHWIPACVGMTDSHRNDEQPRFQALTSQSYAIARLHRQGASGLRRNCAIAFVVTMMRVVVPL